MKFIFYFLIYEIYFLFLFMKFIFYFLIYEIIFYFYLWN